MVDIMTDVMITGAGPAGGATAALLTSFGVENFIINRYRWLTWRATKVSANAEKNLSSALKKLLGY